MCSKQLTGVPTVTHTPFTTADNNCSVMTVALLTTAVMSCHMSCQVKQEAVLIPEHIFLLETWISPRQRKGSGGVRYDYSKWISGAISIVFRSNYGYILLSFQDITTGQTTDWWKDRRQTDVSKHHIFGSGGRASYNAVLQTEQVIGR